MKMNIKFISLIVFLLFTSFASAQLCEQCDTSKAVFFPSPAILSGGSCGYGDLYGPHIAAARQNIYRNGEGCGACYQIRCENDNLCKKEGTNIVVTDLHNAKDNVTDFVLSRRAARAMALPGKDKLLLGQGIVDIEYKRVPCVYKGHNLSIQVEAYSKPPNYLAIKLLYQGGQTRILGAEVIGNDKFPTWVSMSRNHGAVFDTSSAPKGELEFRFIISSGYDAQYFYSNQVLPVKWIPGVVYNTTVQINNIAIENCKECKGFKA